MDLPSGPVVLSSVQERKATPSRLRLHCSALFSNRGCILALSYTWETSDAKNNAATVLRNAAARAAAAAEAAPPAEEQYPKQQPVAGGQVALAQESGAVRMQHYQNDKQHMGTARTSNRNGRTGCSCRTGSSNSRNPTNNSAGLVECRTVAKAASRAAAVR